MPYEQGMTVAIENKKCIVHFRGKRYELPGTFEDFAAARKAGEDFCKRLGWAG